MVLHEVTDVYGPRLTGSPGLRAAQDFAVGQMTKWGFSNAPRRPRAPTWPPRDSRVGIAGAG